MGELQHYYVLQKAPILNFVKRNWSDVEAKFAETLMKFGTSLQQYISAYTNMSLSKNMGEIMCYRCGGNLTCKALDTKPYIKSTSKGTHHLKIKNTNCKNKECHLCNHVHLCGHLNPYTVCERYPAEDQATGSKQDCTNTINRSTTPPLMSKCSQKNVV